MFGKTKTLTEIIYMNISEIFDLRNNPKPVVDPNVANCPRQSQIKDTEVKEPEARTGLQIKHEDKPNKDIPMDWGPAIRTSFLSEIDTPVILNEDPFRFRSLNIFLLLI